MKNNKPTNTLEAFMESRKKEFFAVHEPGMHPDNIFLTPFEEYLLEDMFHKQEKTKDLKAFMAESLGEYKEIWK